MALLDPIPSPVETRRFAALEWEPLLALVAGFAASPVGRAAILAFHPSTDEELDHAAASAHGRSAAAARGAGLDSAGRAVRSAPNWRTRRTSPMRRLKQRSCRPWRAWRTTLPPGNRCCASRRRGWWASCRDCRRCRRACRAACGRWRSRSSARFSPMGRWPTTPRLSWAAFAASRSGSAESSKNPCAPRCASFPRKASTQEDVITIRGDRFVIPVRSELKRRVGGVVHGASSSGQTVYVEPLETIEQNNELVRLFEEEQAEIHRIFVALTRQVGATGGGSGGGRARAGAGR